MIWDLTQGFIIKKRGKVPVSVFKQMFDISGVSVKRMSAFSLVLLRYGQFKYVFGLLMYKCHSVTIFYFVCGSCVCVPLFLPWPCSSHSCVYEICIVVVVKWFKRVFHYGNHLTLLSGWINQVFYWKGKKIRRAVVNFYFSSACCEGYKRILQLVLVVPRLKTTSWCGMQSYLGKTLLIHSHLGHTTLCVELMMTNLFVFNLTALKEHPLRMVSNSLRSWLLCITQKLCPTW